MHGWVDELRGHDTALRLVGIRRQLGYVEIGVEGDILLREVCGALRLPPPLRSPTARPGLTRVASRRDGRSRRRRTPICISRCRSDQRRAPPALTAFQVRRATIVRVSWHHIPRRTTPGSRPTWPCWSGSARAPTPFVRRARTCTAVLARSALGERACYATPRVTRPTPDAPSWHRGRRAFKSATWDVCFTIIVLARLSRSASARCVC